MSLSPFLPGTKIQFAWDSTSISYLKTCPRLYQYIMLEGWTPKDDSIHLRFGQEYHKAIEEYHQYRFAGESYDESLRRVVRGILTRTRDWDPDTDTRAGKYKNPRTLVQLIVDYLDKYRDDPAQTIEKANGVPAVELSFRFELDWGPQAATAELPQLVYNENAKKLEAGNVQCSQPYLLCGHLDRVVTYADQVFVEDHKTTLTTPGPYFFDSFNPDNQMSLYSLAGQVVLGSAIKGVMIDAAQILLEKPNNFVRGFTYRTPDQTAEWLHDLKYWFSQAEHYANEGYWPMNDKSCGQYGGCKFRGVCSKDPSVRERFLEAQFVKLPKEERWNPLKPR